MKYEKAHRGNAAGADAGDAGAGNNAGQYEVIDQNEDGTYTVMDNVDGDVWIVKGEYEIGDYIPQSE